MILEASPSRHLSLQAPGLSTAERIGVEQSEGPPHLQLQSIYMDMTSMRKCAHQEDYNECGERGHAAVSVVGLGLRRCVCCMLVCGVWRVYCDSFSRVMCSHGTGSEWLVRSIAGARSSLVAVATCGGGATRDAGESSDSYAPMRVIRDGDTTHARASGRFPGTRERHAASREFGRCSRWPQALMDLHTVFSYTAQLRVRGVLINCVCDMLGPTERCTTTAVRGTQEPCTRHE